MDEDPEDLHEQMTVRVMTMFAGHEIAFEGATLRDVQTITKVCADIAQDIIDDLNTEAVDIQSIPGT